MPRRPPLYMRQLLGRDQEFLYRRTESMEAAKQPGHDNAAKIIPLHHVKSACASAESITRWERPTCFWHRNSDDTKLFPAGKPAAYHTSEPDNCSRSCLWHDLVPMGTRRNKRNINLAKPISFGWTVQLSKLNCHPMPIKPVSHILTFFILTTLFFSE